MNFSSIALQQREQEIKTLRTFLTYSLIGSLTLHIGLLASGIGNLLMKVPEMTEEPLEITMVETPPKIESKPLEKLELTQPDIAENSRILTNSNSRSGGGGGGGLSINNISSTSELKPQQNKVASAVVPFPKIEDLKPLPSIPKEPVSERKLEPQSQVKASAPQNILTQTSSRDSTTVQAFSQSSANLSKLLAGIRDNGSNQGVLQPSQGTVGGNGAVTSNSSGLLGSGSGSGSGSKVATAPTTPKLSTNSGRGNGRAACRECDTNYPDWARRRGVEGRVEVAVDTDNQGNVTKVRLLRSSGNEKLDAEHLDRAQKWKLKPSSEGRQGVSIGTEYAIAGSQRHRQLQERKKQRESEQRNAASTNNASNSASETPRRSRRLVTSVNENIPREPNPITRRIRRSRNTAASTESASTSSATKGQRLGEALRRRRNPAVTNASSSSGQTTKRRRRREATPASPVTNNSQSSPQPSSWRRRLQQPASSEPNQQP
ncbi:energy transducer TonB [Anabaena sp. PCC 7938]|uniref:energy transducer TonB n=1 Tax=Anabaena sp. PCC 7938 TaxID=1296340 RepID=UPI0020305124|nr:energy transducer TonB [Anabaena sp. CCAP 1446/1C]